MKLRTLQDAPIKKGTRVIVRADFDVVTGRIEDNFKIRECLATIRFVLRKGGRVRIVSHLGRPHGVIVRRLSMKSIAQYLGKLLGRRVFFISDPLSRKIFQRYDSLSDILFFENIRFWPGEEKNNTRFASDLAKWGDLYVNEAFADSHRTHASVVALPKQLSSFAGFQTEEETAFLNRALQRASKAVVVIGGVKLETKIPVITRFLDRGSTVFVGGAPANTFFLARGMRVGKSLVEPAFLKKVASLLKNKKCILPTDLLVGKGKGFPTRVISAHDHLRPSEMILDVGQETAQHFGPVFKSVRTIVWNGPVGIAEQYPKGTYALARAVARARGLKIVGGGDTIAFLRKYSTLKGFSHVSTGGGAMLEFLAGKKLPGIEVLR